MLSLLKRLFKGRATTLPQPADAMWQALADNLALCVSALEQDEYLILRHRDRNVYIQVADRGPDGVRIEAAGNNYIEPPEALLTVEQFTAMDALGWRRANLSPDPPTEMAGERNRSPNFFVHAERGDNMAVIAEMCVRTMREVYDIPKPHWLTYSAFTAHNESIRFPTLGLTRRAASVNSRSQLVIDDDA